MDIQFKAEDGWTWEFATWKTETWPASIILGIETSGQGYHIELTKKDLTEMLKLFDSED